MIDNKEIPVCNDCNIKGVYIGKYDSYACPSCRQWLTTCCKEPDNCLFCMDRPEFYIKEQTNEEF